MSDIFLTSEELFYNQAASFSFELGEEELVAEGLKRGFITQVNNPTGGYLYLVNQDYVSGEKE